MDKGVVAGTGGGRVLQAQMAVAAVLGVRLVALCGKRRGTPRTSFARQAAMYPCHVAFRMTLADVGRAFGRKRGTVCHAVQRIAEAREDPELDRALQWLESWLAEAAHG